MKEGRRHGFPFKQVERYTPKRPTSEAGQPALGVLGQPEQLPHDGGLNVPEPQPPKGEIQPNVSGQRGEESTAPQRRILRRRGLCFVCPLPIFPVEELRDENSKDTSD